MRWWLRGLPRHDLGRQVRAGEHRDAFRRQPRHLRDHLARPQPGPRLDALHQRHDHRFRPLYGAPKQRGSRGGSGREWRAPGTRRRPGQGPGRSSPVWPVRRITVPGVDGVGDLATAGMNDHIAAGTGQDLRGGSPPGPGRQHCRTHHAARTVQVHRDTLIAAGKGGPSYRPPTPTPRRREDTTRVNCPGTPAGESGRQEPIPDISPTTSADTVPPRRQREKYESGDGRAHLPAAERRKSFRVQEHRVWMDRKRRLERGPEHPAPVSDRPHHHGDPGRRKARS